MKQIISLFTISLLFVFVSCSNDKTANSGSDTMSSEKKSSPTAEKNLASNKVVMDAFASGDAGGIDSAVNSDFVGHSERGDMNRDSLKAMISMAHKMYPNMKMESVKVLGDDDYVFALVHMTGVGPADMNTIEVTKFKDGKAAEHWSYMTMQDMMKMMPEAPPMKMEEKKKAK